MRTKGVLNSSRLRVMNCLYFFLGFTLLYSPILIACQEEDEDIPVIEGDGGTITTAVEDGVLILTHENFDLQISSKEIMLVEFYAPWCGHCKALEPEFAKAAKILREGETPIYLAKVDATLETDLVSRFGVTGFPTLYIFKKGEKVLYEGPRTAMGIVEYMKERSDPNWKPPPEAVITLTKENFTEIVDNSEIILVEFYAPWCGHCKSLAPEYERAAQVLKDLPKPIPLAKVDGIVEKELAETYDTQGWPTLIVFRKGRKYPYEGPRDEPGIISYMKEQAKPPSKEFGTFKTFKSVVSNSDGAVVGFFDVADSLYENFIESAHSLRGKFVFMHSFKKDVRKSFNIEGVKIIVFLPEIYTTEYEPKKFVMDNTEATSKDITAFIQENSIPLVGERSYKTRWLYEKAYPLVVVYYDVDFSFDHRVQTQLVQKEVAKVAKDYKGRITFAISNENEHQDELQQLNLDDSGEDVNVGYYHSEKIRYRMEPTEDFSEDELRSFVEDVISGNIPRHIKSQPAPKQNGPVYTIVGSTFEELVLNNEKDVLIEFYAPWCGHCKKLEPIYKKLGKAFENNNEVMIAKIDGTANDFPGEYQVTGFPTIFYLPAADKTKLVTFNGERTLKELTKFVNDQLKKRSSKDEL